MLKVGRKGKERKTKSTQTLLPGFELAHETSPRSQKTKYKTRSISKNKLKKWPSSCKYLLQKKLKQNIV